MNKTIYIVIFATILIAANASADGLCEQYLSMFKSSEGKQLLDSVPVSNERANLYTRDGALIGHVVVTDKNITSIGCDELPDPTYKVTTLGMESLMQIKLSKNKLETASEQLRTKGIKIKGMTFSKKIKGAFMTSAVKTVGRIIGLFGGSDDDSQGEGQEDEECEPTMGDNMQCNELGGTYNWDTCECEDIPNDCESDDDCVQFRHCEDGTCSCEPTMGDNMQCAGLGGKYNWDTCICENPLNDCETDADCIPLRHCEEGRCKCTPLMSDNVECYQELGGTYDWETCVCEIQE